MTTTTTGLNASNMGLDCHLVCPTEGRITSSDDHERARFFKATK